MRRVDWDKLTPASSSHGQEYTVCCARRDAQRRAKGGTSQLARGPAVKLQRQVGGRGLEAALDDFQVLQTERSPPILGDDAERVERIVVCDKR